MCVCGAYVCVCVFAGVMVFCVGVAIQQVVLSVDMKTNISFTVCFLNDFRSVFVQYSSADAVIVFFCI